MIPNAVRGTAMSGDVRNRSRRLSRWIHQEIDAHSEVHGHEVVVGSSPLVGVGSGWDAGRGATVVPIFKSEPPANRFADAGATLTALYVSR